MSRQEWRADALCAEVGDTEMFFPEKGGSTADARRICGMCDVQAACLAWALETNQEHGIWGGTTRAEREQLRRGQRQRPDRVAVARAKKSRHDPEQIAAAVDAILAGQRDALVTLSASEKDAAVAQLAADHGTPTAADLLHVSTRAVEHRTYNHRRRTETATAA